MSQPANVNAVFEAVKDISNKESQGMFTPTTFNRFASVVQLDVINELLEMRKDYYSQRLRFKPMKNGIHDIQQVEDSLALVYRDGVNMTVGAAPTLWAIPSDLMTIETLFAEGEPLDILPTAIFAYSMRSGLAAPTTTNRISRRKNSTEFEIQPAPNVLAPSVTVTYYKRPEGVDPLGVPTTSQPTWAGILINPTDAEETYDPSSSVNFEVGNQAENMLIIKMLSYLGVNLNHELLVEYAEAKDAKDDVEQEYRRR